MLNIAKSLVKTAIIYADAALAAREGGHGREADRQSQNADHVAACAAQAASSYVLGFGGDHGNPALSLLEAAESYGQEAGCL